ncbi:MAG: putative metal-dependent hydrolase [Ignavibacteriae bacterium]|nr:MAG: putative metal-dependent hydrolase [Ignavibacteriota bacterium]
MNQQDIEILRYPIGKFLKPEPSSAEFIAQSIERIEQYPVLLKNEVAQLSNEELNLRYRPDGWNIRQVVHHTADSHMNAFVRFKLVLTESTPTIKPYHENLWAELADTVNAPIEASVKILEGLHLRWAALLQACSEKDFEKKYFHPEQKREVVLKDALALYAWHCKHHLAHIQQAKKYRGKFE